MEHSISGKNSSSSLSSSPPSPPPKENNDIKPPPSAATMTGKGQPPLGKTTGKWVPRPLVTVCLVCGSPASKIRHYGAVSCYSCRAFFRRSVGRPREYRACYSGSNNCQVDFTTRVNCKRCRLNKCLKVGMKIEKVNRIIRRREAADAKLKKEVNTSERDSPPKAKLQKPTKSRPGRPPKTSSKSSRSPPSTSFSFSPLSPMVIDDLDDDLNDVTKNPSKVLTIRPNMSAGPSRERRLSVGVENQNPTGSDNASDCSPETANVASQKAGEAYPELSGERRGALANDTWAENVAETATGIKSNIYRSNEDISRKDISDSVSYRPQNYNIARKSQPPTASPILATIKNYSYIKLLPAESSSLAAGHTVPANLSTNQPTLKVSGDISWEEKMAAFYSTPEFGYHKQGIRFKTLMPENRNPEDSAQILPHLDWIRIYGEHAPQGGTHEIHRGHHKEGPRGPYSVEGGTYGPQEPQVADGPHNLHGNLADSHLTVQGPLVREDFQTNQHSVSEETKQHHNFEEGRLLPMYHHQQPGEESVLESSYRLQHLTPAYQGPMGAVNDSCQPKLIQSVIRGFPKATDFQRQPANVDDNLHQSASIQDEMEDFQKQGEENPGCGSSVICTIDARNGLSEKRNHEGEPVQNFLNLPAPIKQTDLLLEEEFQIHELHVNKEAIFDSLFKVSLNKARFEQITSNFFTALHTGNYSSITPADFAMANVPPQALPHIFKINSQFERLDPYVFAQIASFSLQSMHIFIKAVLSANEGQGTFLKQSRISGTLTQTIADLYNEVFKGKPNKELLVPSFNPLKIGFVSPWAASLEDEVKFSLTMETAGSLIKTDYKLGTLFCFLLVITPHSSSPYKTDLEITRIQKELCFLIYRHLKAKHKSAVYANNILRKLLSLIPDLHECRDIHLNRRIHA